LFVENGVVHPTLPAHADSPIFPHAPPWQPPFVHVPCPPEHVPALATHVLVL
jgi:hypothetical protein